VIRLAGIAVAAAIVLLGGYMVWNGPRCSGPLPSDRCPMIAKAAEPAEPAAPKADRLDLKPVATVRIVPEAPAPLVPLMMPDLPPPRQTAPTPPMPHTAPRMAMDICASHGLRKVYAGRGWRCRH
jgi:hypothetical protein